MWKHLGPSTHPCSLNIAPPADMWEIPALVTGLNFLKGSHQASTKTACRVENHLHCTTLEWTQIDLSIRKNFLIQYMLIMVSLPPTPHSFFSPTQHYILSFCVSLENKQANKQKQIRIKKKTEKNHKVIHTKI